MKKAFSSVKSKKPQARPEAPKTPQIRVAKGVYRRFIASTFASFLGWTLVALVVVYACFAVTIMRVLPTDTNLGFIPVKNITYPGGIVPEGELIVANTSASQGDGLLDRMRQAVVPSASTVLVKVKAGPYGRVAWAPSGLTTVDGKSLGIILRKDPETKLLNKQYIGECLGGACEVGEGVMIPEGNIYGEPLKKRS